MKLKIVSFSTMMMAVWYAFVPTPSMASHEEIEVLFKDGTTASIRPGVKCSLKGKGVWSGQIKTSKTEFQFNGPLINLEQPIQTLVPLFQKYPNVTSAKLMIVENSVDENYYIEIQNRENLHNNIENKDMVNFYRDIVEITQKYKEKGSLYATEQLSSYQNFLAVSMYDAIETMNNPETMDNEIKTIVELLEKSSLSNKQATENLKEISNTHGVFLANLGNSKNINLQNKVEYFKKSIRYLEKAQKLGHPNALNNIANVCFLRGESFFNLGESEENFETCVTYFRKSLKQIIKAKDLGHKSAINNLKEAYFAYGVSLVNYGNSLENDLKEKTSFLKKSLKHLEQAQKLGQKEATKNMAIVKNLLGVAFFQQANNEESDHEKFLHKALQMFKFSYQLESSELAKVNFINTWSILYPEQEIPDLSVPELSIKTLSIKSPEEEIKEDTPNEKSMNFDIPSGNHDKELEIALESVKNRKKPFWHLKDVFKENPTYKNEKNIPLLIEFIKSSEDIRLSIKNILESYPHQKLISFYLLSEKHPSDLEKYLTLLIDNDDFMKQDGKDFFDKLMETTHTFNFKTIMKVLRNSKVETNFIINLVLKAANQKENKLGLHDIVDFCEQFITNRKDYTKEQGQRILSNLSEIYKDDFFWKSSYKNDLKKALFNNK